MMPSQKLGAAKQSTASAEINVSQTLLTRIADSTPALHPTSTASEILASIKISVAGRCVRITSSTGMFCRYE